MRNLKKVLSLSLALVMLLGMMVVGAGAATNLDVYADKANINKDYLEAVDLLTGLQILEGDDGGFRPTDTLTREQAAKLVAYVSLGRDAAESLSVSSAPFTDVAATRWSAGYIAYCANIGVINGVGDGSFRPTDEVTGYQFAKMLLCVIGYGQNKEYVGANWALNVSRDGVTTGLFQRLDTVGNTAATREEAAQLAFNAMTMQMVTYSTLYGTYSAYENSALGNSTTLLGTKLRKVFNVVAVPYDNELGFGYRYWKYVNKAGAITDEYMTDNILGEITSGTVGAMYKNYSWQTVTNTNGQSVEYLDLVENGVSVDNLTLGKRADGKTTSGSTTLLNVKKGAHSAMRNSTAPAVSYNGQVLYVVDSAQNEHSAQVVGDGAADKLVVVTTYLAEVTNVTAATASANRQVTVKVYVPNAANTITKSFETDNYAKGDYIMVTPSGTQLDKLTSAANATAVAGAFGDIVDSVACEVVKGTVSAYYAVANNSTGLSNAGSVGVEGKKRSYNGIFHTGKRFAPPNTQVALGQDIAEEGYTLLNATYAFYLDALGNVAGVKVVEDSIGNFAYILDVGQDIFGRKNTVKALLSDGTVGVYTVSNNSGKNYNDTNTAGGFVDATDGIYDDGVDSNNLSTVGIGRIYAYSLNGTTITLTALPKVGLASNSTASGKYANPVNSDGRSTLLGKITGFTKGYSTLTYTSGATNAGNVAYATDETVFFYIDTKGTVTRYVGKNNAPSVTGTSVVNSEVSIATEKVGTTTYATMVVIENTPNVVASDYLYITKNAYFGTGTDLNGKTVYYYEAILNGVSVNIAATNSSLSKTGVHTYSLKANDFTGGNVDGYTITNGVYTLGTAGVKTVTGTVYVKSNEDAIVLNNRMDMITNGATIYSLADKATVDRLNVGDEVEIVYSTDPLNVAKTIYVTKSANVVSATSVPSTINSDEVYTVLDNYTGTVINNGKLYVTGAVDMTNITNNGTVIAHTVTAGNVKGNMTITGSQTATLAGIDAGASITFNNSISLDVLTNVLAANTGKITFGTAPVDGTTTQITTANIYSAAGTTLTNLSDLANKTIVYDTVNSYWKVQA